MNKLIPAAAFLVLGQAAIAAPTVWSSGTGANGHSYEVFSVPAGIDWDEAEALAISKGGHLASITSEEENAFVFSLIGSNAAYWVGPDFAGNGIGPWIGGYQPVGGSSYLWTDGSPFSFTKWAPFEPNDLGGGEARIQFFGYGTLTGSLWNDYPESPGGSQPKPVSYIVEFAAIPEPASSSLILGAAAILCSFRRRQAR